LRTRLGIKCNEKEMKIKARKGGMNEWKALSKKVFRRALFLNLESALFAIFVQN